MSVEIPGVDPMDADTNGLDDDVPACTACGDSGLVDWMIESDPNCYQEPDADGSVPCPDCRLGSAGAGL